MKGEFRVWVKQKFMKFLIFAIVLFIVYVIAVGISAIVDFTYKPPEIVQREDEIKDSYVSSVLGSTEIKEEDVDGCVQIINDFVKYGNEKNYDMIYAMLNEDYKKLYMKDITVLKTFIDTYFVNQKSCSYQNVANYGNYYIFNVRIYDDIMLYGVNDYNNTNQTKIMLIISSIDNELKISLNGYVYSANVGISAENEYVKFNIKSKDVFFDKTVFNVTIENLTSDRILAFYDNDVEYLVYNKDNDNISEMMMDTTILKTSANAIFPKGSKDLKFRYNKYLGSSFMIDYRINIAKLYAYNATDYMEVLISAKDLREKALATYSNVYISL